MARFMTSAFDTNDFLANFRFGMSLETEQEVRQLVDTFAFVQARVGRTLGGRPQKVVPADAESEVGDVQASSRLNGKTPMWVQQRQRQPLSASTPSYANAAAKSKGASSSTPPPPAPPPSRDSSPSGSPRWADVAAAATEKSTNTDRVRADWAHMPVPRMRRASKEQALKSARRGSRGRGARSRARVA